MAKLHQLLQLTVSAKDETKAQSYLGHQSSPRRPWTMTTIFLAAAMLSGLSAHRYSVYFLTLDFLVVFFLD